jgi:hypothetical protein
MGDGEDIHSTQWMMVKRFTPHQGWWWRDSLHTHTHHEWWWRYSLHIMYDGEDIHSTQWMMVKRFTPHQGWWWRYSLHTTEDGEDIHSAPWMMVKRFNPHHDDDDKIKNNKDVKRLIDLKIYVNNGSLKSKKVGNIYFPLCWRFSAQSNTYIRISPRIFGKKSKSKTGSWWVVD